MGNKNPPKEHQFKPGQSGNPKGRPPGMSVENQLRALFDLLLDENCPLTGETGKKKVSHLVNAQLVAKAAKEGDLKAIDMIYDRLEGKALARNQEVPSTLEDALNELEKEGSDTKSDTE